MNANEIEMEDGAAQKTASLIIDRFINTRDRRIKQKNFMRALLGHLLDLLIEGDGGFMPPHSPSQRNDLIDSLGVHRFMESIEPLLAELSKDERLDVIETLASAIAQTAITDKLGNSTPALYA
jgi:hypothetical protein